MSKLYPENCVICLISEKKCCYFGRNFGIFYFFCWCFQYDKFIHCNLTDGLVPKSTNTVPLLNTPLSNPSPIVNSPLYPHFGGQTKLTTHFFFFSPFWAKRMTIPYLWKCGILETMKGCCGLW